MKNRISPLKYFVSFLIFTSVFQFESSAQGCYNAYVDSIVSRVSLQSVSMFDRELSGDTSTNISGLLIQLYQGTGYTRATIKQHSIYMRNFSAMDFRLITRYLLKQAQT